MAKADDTKGPPWEMAIAFRNETPTDSLQLKCATKLSCSEGDIAHVDLLFNVVCEGAKKCQFKGRHYTNIDKSEHKRGCMHVLSYSIRNTAESNTVECTVSPGFFKYRGWSILQVHPKNEDQIVLSRDFMISHLGDPYNEVGYKWNWLLGWVGLARGATLQKDIKVGHVAKRRPWFCSELVISALIYSGIIRASDWGVDPRATSPGDIWKYCMGKRQTFINLLIDDVVPDEPCENNTASATAASPLLSAPASATAVRK